MAARTRVGLIGLGYWGSNYLRVVNETDGASLDCVCDVDPRRAAYFDSSNRSIKFVRDPEGLATSKNLDAVILATPASTHYELVKKMLEGGKHVLVEKPLVMDSVQAKELCQISKEMEKILMVGHIYCFNPAVKYIKTLLVSKKLGHLFYGTGLRLGWGPIRGDASCTWDLATHDIAMLDYLLHKVPKTVTATASSFINGKDRKIYDYANIQLAYDNGFRFGLTVSWYAAEKIRMWYLTGSKSMVKFDDLTKETPITIYNKTSRNANATRGGFPKEGDALLPFVGREEPLRVELKQFVASVTQKGGQKWSNCWQGARVVKVIECIEKSIDSGRPIDVY